MARRWPQSNLPFKTDILRKISFGDQPRVVERVFAFLLSFVFCREDRSINHSGGLDTSPQ